MKSFSGSLKSCLDVSFLHQVSLIGLEEAVARKFSVIKVLLEISQNSQENNCVRVSFLMACNFIKKENLSQVFSCEFWEISKNTFSYRTPPVAASGLGKIKQNVH